MHGGLRNTLSLLAAGLLVAAAHAQESQNFTLSDHEFTAAAEPSLASPAYTVTEVSVGVASVESGMSSPGYRADGGGLNMTYPPPAEVLGLRFVGPQTLVWDPEASAGGYNLYRGILSVVADPDYGDCRESAISETTTTDADLPPADDAFFYLVTAENQLGEEGVKGLDSAGIPRANPEPCP